MVALAQVFFCAISKMYISDVFTNFPAQKADIRQGDQMLKINDIELAGKTNDQVSQLLKGSKGAVIKLLMKRDADAPVVKRTWCATKLNSPTLFIRAWWPAIWAI
jgi:C-terminal processing protease CtpA/Prc